MPDSAIGSMDKGKEPTMQQYLASFAVDKRGARHWIDGQSVTRATWDRFERHARHMSDIKSWMDGERACFRATVWI